MANQGQIPARQAAVKGGMPLNIPATTVNKVCLSGLNAIYLADLLIQAGEADIVIAGGMESMTNAPYLLPGARGGFRYGNTELLDAIMRDGLWCAFDACLMGAGTERYTRRVDLPGGPGRRGRHVARAGRQRHQGRSLQPTRSCRCPCRSARATRSSSRPTRASGRAPRRRASAA